MPRPGAHAVPPPVEDLLGRTALILGEVNRGKSTLLLHILKAFQARGETGLTVIDLAPEAVGGIGGKLAAATAPGLRYLTAPIVAPRLTGKSEQEAWALARANAEMIEDLFDRRLKTPGRALFINDVSIYLQAGAPEKLLHWLAGAPTVVMNGYYGRSLGGGELGETERRRMEGLREACDLVIEL